VNAAIQVIQHMNSGMTVVDACKEIGLRRSSFYDIVKKYPEAIAEYQEMVEANAVFYSWTNYPNSECAYWRCCASQLKTRLSLLAAPQDRSHFLQISNFSAP
jgi:hypothetical protein